MRSPMPAFKSFLIVWCLVLVLPAQAKEIPETSILKPPQKGSDRAVYMSSSLWSSNAILAHL